MARMSDLPSFERLANIDAQIVRDLAALDIERGDSCRLCDGEDTQHKPSCPWRRAREAYPR